MAVHNAVHGYRDNAETYATMRPAYPDEAVDRLTAELRLRPGIRTLDLGAGTGKFTRQLTDRGADLTAIEPIPAMLQRLHADLPGVAACRASAEAQPFRSSVFDVAVAAQAWHWFDGRAVLTELERTLVPGGRLGLIWNEYDTSERWVEDYYAIRYSRAGPGVPDHRSGTWRQAFRERPQWSPPESSRHPYLRSMTPSGLVDLMLSSSVMGRLDVGGKAQVADEVRGTIERHPGLRGRDRIDLPYVAECWWTRLR
jgi:SAM-dependent methyltransferase